MSFNMISNDVVLRLIIFKSSGYESDSSMPTPILPGNATFFPETLMTSFAANIRILLSDKFDRLAIDASTKTG